MSMRASFTTEFIYDGLEGYLDRYEKLVEVFNSDREYKGGNMIGRITGLTKGLDLGEQDIRDYIDEMCKEAYGIAKVPFKIVWLFESGDVIIREIRTPHQEQEARE